MAMIRVHPTAFIEGEHITHIALEPVKGKPVIDVAVYLQHTGNAFRIGGIAGEGFATKIMFDILHAKTLTPPDGEDFVVPEYMKDEMEAVNTAKERINSPESAYRP